MNAWYNINYVENVDTPALVLYRDRIKLNIDNMIAVAGDPTRLRPHVKTYKMTEVVALMVHRGIHKFKCATIAEAEMLGISKVQDVMLAYQPVGPKIKRFISLQKKYSETQFSTIVDNQFTANKIADECQKMSISLNVFIDLNVGMNRTGILPGEEALQLYKYCLDLDGIHPLGLHTYDGHLHHKDFTERTALCDQAYEPVAELALAIKKNTGIKPQIVAGGTPTFPIHAKRKQVELSPGTCVLWDYGYYQMLAEQNYLFGALVLTRVISKLPENRLCLDLGHKSIAAENPFPRVIFLNLPEAREVSQSEEHLVVEVGDASAIEIGTVLYGVPIHICPTCALYERAIVIKDHSIIDEWAVIARDRIITI